MADPKDARKLLRSGSFSGLRASVWAIGEYTAERGAGKAAGTEVVTSFFKELEGLDYALLTAERAEDATEGTALAREKLETTIAALDKLIANVPEDALNNARRVVSSLREAEELEGKFSGEALDTAEIQRLQKLF